MERRNGEDEGVFANAVTLPITNKGRKRPHLLSCKRGLGAAWVFSAPAASLSSAGISGHGATGVPWASRVQLICGLAYTIMTTDVSADGRQTMPQVSFNVCR